MATGLRLHGSKAWNDGGLLAAGLAADRYPRPDMEHPIHIYTAPRSDRLSQRWAALAFGSPMLRDLDANEQIHLAQTSKAIFEELVDFSLHIPGPNITKLDVVAPGRGLRRTALALDRGPVTWIERGCATAAIGAASRRASERIPAWVR